MNTSFLLNGNGAILQPMPLCFQLKFLPALFRFGSDLNFVGHPIQRPEKSQNSSDPLKIVSALLLFAARGGQLQWQTRIFQHSVSVF